MTTWPSVEVLIPTHNRPEMLSEAIASVVSQDYPGELSVLVIFDREPAQQEIASEGPGIRIRVIENTRTPGLAGARNSGVLASNADFVAFCDDDDMWLPGKLRKQVERWLAEPSASFLTTSVQVEFSGNRSPRFAGVESVPHSQLLESRMSMLHSSTFLIRRESLVQIGLVDEGAPGSQNEDWELLLRVSREQSIAHVDEPLVTVRWGATSLFASAWESKIRSLQWILERYPEITSSSVGYARVIGQIAFAYAALRERRMAFRYCIRGARVRPLEPRSYLAALVASGLVPARFVLSALHRRGRGV